MYPNEFSAGRIRAAIADLRKIRSGDHVDNVFRILGHGPRFVPEREVKESLRRAWKTRWTMRPAE